MPYHGYNGDEIEDLEGDNMRRDARENRQTLTPAQFTVARALAQSYHHLWAWVPDGTYNIQDIKAWSDERQHPMLPDGIHYPDLSMEDDRLYVFHETGSGRLKWKINPVGNVELEIHRPGNSLNWGYKKPYSTDYPQSICVLKTFLISDQEEKNVYSFTQGDIEFLSNDEDITGTPVYNFDTDKEEAYKQKGTTRFSYEEDVHTELLFERHVSALIKPMVALLTLNIPESPDPDDEEEAYQSWRAQYIQPAIDQAESWLAPFFEIALPDPTWVQPDWYQEEQILPETYWARSKDQENIWVHHNGEDFPVESDKTAVHAVLLLRQNPEMSLYEAVKAGVQARTYRF